ncbi:hypothetical protein JAAARDRAFT_39320 [Jaapia argillacea MUCL 33604]|uniref:RING-type domain-containing protein n=1 Tax=Jaapia argillacea MUCL 33604 TaxID=933084 RepID=A0A067PFS9_9AGAM|nr:hypothetical protein JAAARDRAFT_39320 [Jaapia argillacea MUCL 33604]
MPTTRSNSNQPPQAPAGRKPFQAKNHTHPAVRGPGGARKTRAAAAASKTVTDKIGAANPNQNTPAADNPIAEPNVNATTNTNAKTLPVRTEMDVIIIDSDDENPPPRKRQARAKVISKSRGKGKAIPMDDVVEISSDEEPESQSKEGGAGTNLDGQAGGSEDVWKERIRKLEQEVTRWKTQTARESSKRKAQANDDKAKLTSLMDVSDELNKVNKNLIDEKARLKAEIEELKKAKGKMDLSALDDLASCEICTFKMWEPYTLPACGHTFCQSCLTDWFNTTLAQHLTLHPNYTALPHIPHNYLPYIQNPTLNPVVTQQIKTHLRAQMEARVEPGYSCPSCREVVKGGAKGGRPVRVWVLRDMVREVGRLTGEKGPDEGKIGRGGAKQEGVWEGFWPSLLD